MAILLLPLCVGVGRALGQLIAQSGFVDTTVAPRGAGVACMFLLYHWVPKPMWIYVFGHEFTHAAATMAFGGRVTGLKVTSDGGHVLVTKDNFIITLAPYFIPLYAAAVLVVFAIGRAIWDWNGPWTRGIFFWALGATYTFHILLTWHILHTRQPDVTSQERVFSTVISFAGIVPVLLIGLPHLMDGISLWDVCKFAQEGTVQTFRDISALTVATWNLCNSALN